MTQHTFGRITVSSDGKLKLPMYQDAGAVQACEVIEFEATDLAPMMVEIVCTYDVQPVAINEIIPPELLSILVGFPKQFKGVDLLFDEEVNADKFVATAKNGDTGAKDQGFGECAVAAVADLARAHGFKSKLPDDGELTILQWFQDFQYGFKRISDEILQAEMDEIYAPEKGAW